MILIICYSILALAYVVCGIVALEIYTEAVTVSNSSMSENTNTLDRLTFILFWPLVVFFIGVGAILDGLHIGN